MTSLSDIHLKNQATMGVYNNRTLPSAYHSPSEEYKAVRENVLLVDYSHMSIVSVMGEDAWALVNYMASADVSIIRDEQGIYSLVLNDDGTVRGDIYALCTPEGYYILSENLSASDITGILQGILEKADELDIQDIPDITAMDDADWGTIMLEGPYAWELMAEIYGFDVIGLPYYEYMNTDDGLMVFRCGKHGEFAYQMIARSARWLIYGCRYWTSGISIYSRPAVWIINKEYALKTPAGMKACMRNTRVTPWNYSCSGRFSTTKTTLQAKRRSSSYLRKTRSVKWWGCFPLLKVLV